MADWTTPVEEEVAAAPVAEAIELPDSTDDEPVAAEMELDALGRATVPGWVDDAEPEDLTRQLEAVCFALNRPLTLAEAGAVLGRSPKVVQQIAELLAHELRNRGLMLQRHADELQLVTRADVAWVVQRALNPEHPGRLSKPALETLAIVAYRQPTTRATVEAIRGVNCEATLDSLERRGLICEVGRQDTPGHPRLFGTTLRFLQTVGLERIEDLPSLPEGVEVPDVAGPGWGDLGEDIVEALGDEWESDAPLEIEAQATPSAG